jgi:hypothetical protein
MRYEEIIFGALAIFWGVFAFFNRGELYKLAREDGRGLKDIRILKPLVLTASLALPVVGVLLIVFRGL